MAFELGLENVLIVEDDCNFVEQAKLNDDLNRFLNEVPNWDVVMLAHKIRIAAPHNDLVSRTVEATNAASYLVQRHMIPILSQIILDAVPSLRQTGAHWLYQNDVVWWPLMKSHRWFHFNDKLCRQRRSYSDLSQCVADHDAEI
jgi:hypothetical protein